MNNVIHTDMKEKILFCLMLVASFMAGAQNVDGSQQPDSTAFLLQPSERTQYLLIYYSDRYVDSLVRDIGADEVELDNLYAALDDYAFYLNECTNRLENSGQPFFAVDSDARVYVAVTGKWLPVANQGFVLIAVSPDGSVEYINPIDFLSRQDDGAATKEK